MIGEEYDEEMIFCCDYCKKKVRIEGMVVNGLGDRFCSEECMKKGNKNLEEFE